MQGTFEVYEDVSGQWRWRLKAANHEVVAQGEAYTTRQSAEHALAAIRDAVRAEVRPEAES